MLRELVDHSQQCLAKQSQVVPCSGSRMWGYFESAVLGVTSIIRDAAGRAFYGVSRKELRTLCMQDMWSSPLSYLLPDSVNYVKRKFRELD